MSGELLAVALLFVAAIVALVAERFRLPYTIALVVAGIAIAPLNVLPPVHLTRSLLFTLLLPGLLFEAAFHLDVTEVRRNARVIGMLAVPGVVAAAAFTGGIVTLLLRVLGIAQIPLAYGVLFGAIVAATDPIAVVALFRRLATPRRLTVIVEGESLVNDGTGVVLFTVLLAFLSGAQSTTSGLVLEFIRVAGGGVLCGLVIGGLVALLTQSVNELMVETTFTIVAAYGAFALAEEFHLSGVIATVTAGILLGSAARRAAMRPEIRKDVEQFWSYMAFALNSIVFLLLGFGTRPRALLAAWPLVLVAFAAMTLARFMVVGATALIVRRSSERLPRWWATILTWGGIRGALSLVLAISLPESPYRELLVTMTAGAVMLSILLQGLTMPPLLRRLLPRAEQDADLRAATQPTSPASAAFRRPM